jgi:hypothetical protein
VADEIAKLEEIEIIGSPSSVSLEVYRGPEGARGAYIIPGSGSPSNYFDIATQQYIFPDPTGAEEELAAQLYDWYIDLETTSPTYNSTFQLKKNNQWEQIFKVIPNSYSTNKVLLFVSGATNTSIVISKDTLLLSQKFGNQSDTNNLSIFRIPTSTDTVSTISSESQMLALTGQSVGSYAYRSDRSQFFRLKATPSTDINNWQEEISINLDLDIENPIPETPYPVMSSFIIGKPEFDGDEYTFPISIVASQLHPVNGLEAVSGTRTVHISISVI